jgi:hypothetical protein
MCAVSHHMLLTFLFAEANRRNQGVLRDMPIEEQLGINSSFDYLCARAEVSTMRPRPISKPMTRHPALSQPAPQRSRSYGGRIDTSARQHTFSQPVRVSVLYSHPLPPLTSVQQQVPDCPQNPQPRSTAARASATVRLHAQRPAPNPPWRSSGGTRSTHTKAPLLCRRSLSPLHRRSLSPPRRRLPSPLCRRLPSPPHRRLPSPPRR